MNLEGTNRPAEPKPDAPAFGWDRLLDAIERGEVVPIIGRELLVIAGEGPRTTLDQAIARALLSRLRLEKDPSVEQIRAQGSEPSVHDIALLYGKLYPYSANDVHLEIDKILKSAPASWKRPEPLAKLASIEPLQLFVSTTYADCMSQVLEADLRGVITRCFSPHRAPEDLPELAEPTAQPESRNTMAPATQGGPRVVFQAFGRASPLRDFAVTDDQVLEYIRNLQTKLDMRKSGLDRLRERLQSSELLILGLGFPDWLARFVIRAFRVQPFPEGRRARIAEGQIDGEKSLVMFLRHYGNDVYQGDPVAFVDELAKAWGARQAPPSTSASRTALQKKRVYCAYAAEDEKLWEELESQLFLLEEEGHIEISAKSRLKAGEAIDEAALQEAERADIVLLIVSSDFMKRQYGRPEVRRAFERHKTGAAIVVPVLARATMLEGSRLGELVPLPTNGAWITASDNRDQAWAHVARGIKDLVDGRKLRRPRP